MFKTQYGDPNPWVCVVNGETFRYSSLNLDNVAYMFRPRPEFDTTPVNRVLHEFRSEYRFVQNWVAFLDEWIDWVDLEKNYDRIWGAAPGLNYPREEVEFARKVLIRLRNLR